MCAPGSRSASSADLRDGRGVLGSELRITIWILYVFEIIRILSTVMCRVTTTTVHEHVFATNTPSKLAYFYHLFLGNTECTYIFRSFCSHELRSSWVPQKMVNLKAPSIAGWGEVCDTTTLWYRWKLLGEWTKCSECKLSMRVLKPTKDTDNSISMHGTRDTVFDWVVWVVQCDLPIL